MVGYFNATVLARCGCNPHTYIFFHVASSRVGILPRSVSNSDVYSRTDLFLAKLSEVSPALLELLCLSQNVPRWPASWLANLGVADCHSATHNPCTIHGLLLEGVLLRKQPPDAQYHS